MAQNSVAAAGLPGERPVAVGALARPVAVEQKLLEVAVAALELPGSAWNLLQGVILETLAALGAPAYAVLEEHEIAVLTVAADIGPSQGADPLLLRHLVSAR